MEGPWIQTVSGLKFPLMDVDSSVIRIKDIAHALSMVCRFNAQCLRPYSVAEHSVHVSHEITPHLALLGLMHDAAEAYLGDVPGPLKRCLPEFQAIENRLIHAIAVKYGFVYPEKGTAEAQELKRADLQLLADEKAAVMAPDPEPWPLDLPPLKNPARIQGWPPESARARFLARYRELTGLPAAKAARIGL
jgi:5'-deoxynucleotidase YfbR-like HD superfamily hydrolase